MISIQFFEEQIKKSISKNCQGLLNWSSEMVVGISRPSHLENESVFLDQIDEWEFFYKFKRKISKNLLLKLTILKWFLPKEAMVILDTLIDEQIKKFHLDEDIRFNLTSKNRGEMLIYLYERYKNHPDEFFGWFLQKEKFEEEDLEFSIKNIEIFLPIQFWRRKPKAHKPQRKRGYDDKGHLGSDFSKTLKDQASDFSIKEKVLQELERKHRISDLSELLRGTII